jgi:hypothetical protein
MELLLKKLGIEKVKVMDNNFDEIYEKYTQKAKEQGFYGELKFIKEHSKVMIYVVVN